MSAQIFAGGDPSKVSVAGYAKGDLLAANAAGSLQALHVGADTNVLTADSVATVGLDYQAGGGGGGGSPSNTVVTEQAFGQASTAGILVAYSRGDHTHGTMAAPTPASIGAQPVNTNLTTIAGLTPTTDNVIQSVAGAWASRTPAQVKAALVIAQSDVTNLVADLAAKAPLASPTFTGTVTVSGREVVSPDTLTDASTIAVDASLGNYFRCLLTAGVGATRALGAPTNPTDGQKIMFEFIQSSGGSNALTYNAIYAFGTDITGATLTTAANKRDFLGVVYNSTANLWYVIAFVKGY